MKNGKIASGIAALGLALSLTGCGEANRILEQVDNRDFDAALGIYDSKPLKDREIDTLSEGLKTRISTYIDSYAKNEITYEELEKLIDFAELLKVNEITAFITDITDDINSLKTSKANYDSAEKNYELKNYLLTLDYLSKVIEKDCCYSDAQLLKDKTISLYRDELTSKVDEYFGNNDYAGAVSYVRQQTKRLGFPEELASDAENMESKAFTAMAVFQADEYVRTGDIIGALDQIAGVTNNYEIRNMTELTEYIRTISMDEVRTAIDNENYNYALMILNKADEIADDDAITKEIKEIEAVMPVYLYDLTCTKKSRLEIIDLGEELKDSLGNMYTAGSLFTLSTNSSWSREPASAEYYLGKKYGVLSGTIACQNTSDNDAKAIFRIEGDDEVVFEQEVNRKTVPVQFSTDMSKYEWLRISLSNPDGGECNVILADCKFAKPGKAETPAVTEAETTEALGAATEAEGRKAAETEVTTLVRTEEKAEETKAAEETEAAE